MGLNEEIVRWQEMEYNVPGLFVFYEVFIRI